MIRTKFCRTSLCSSSVNARKRFLLVVTKRLMDFVLIRLENEHLNNVGKYRAFNSVPLPFHYDEMAR